MDTHEFIFARIKIYRGTKKIYIHKRIYIRSLSIKKFISIYVFDIFVKKAKL